MQKTLPKGWKTVKLETVLGVLNGYAFDSNKFSGNVGTPLIRIRDLKTNLPNTKYDGEFDSKYLIQDGDFLIGMDGEFRCYEWQGGDALLNQRVCKLNNFDLNKIAPKYIFLNINKYLIEIENKTHFVTVKHISSNQIKNIPVPLPPLPTQHKIVEILEEADNLRKLRQQADEKMKDLIPSLFVQMFGDPATNPKGWKFSKLEELTINITDGKHGDCRNSPDSGYFFISAKDINNGEIDYSNARQIDKDDFFEVHKRTKFEIGDVLITNSGSIGKLAVAKDSEAINKTTFQKSVALIKPKKELLHSIYLMYALDIKKRDLVKTSSGSSQKNLLLSQIRSYKIPLPPLPLQQEFAGRVEEIEAEKARQSESKKKLDELFNSLMQRAFKGKLVA